MATPSSSLPVTPQASSSAEALRAGLNLTRRLPPESVQTTVTGLSILRPDLTEDFLQRIDQPLTVKVCQQTKRKYIACDYNRDGDSFRSPWSNQYDPSLSDGITPSEPLRLMESAANDLFDGYREQYYESGGSSVSSSYFWENNTTDGFASCWLIHKDLVGRNSTGSSTSSTSASNGAIQGIWEAIHVFDVQRAPATTGGNPSTLNQVPFTYKVTTSVLLFMRSDNPNEQGLMKLNGTLTKQVTGTQNVSIERGHVMNMGTMIESIENELRNTIDALYLSKTKEIVSVIRPRGGGGSNMGSLPMMLNTISNGNSSSTNSSNGGGLMNDLANVLQQRNSK